MRAAIILKVNTAGVGTRGHASYNDVYRGLHETNAGALSHPHACDSALLATPSKKGSQSNFHVYISTQIVREQRCLGRAFPIFSPAISELRDRRERAVERTSQ